MKRWWAFFLALALTVTALAGCDPTDADLIEGKWTGEADLAAAYKSLLAAADPAVASHIQLEEFQVKLTLRFESDGTYRWRASEEDLKAGSALMLKAIREGLASYLQEQTGKTIENLLSATNMTMDELMAQYFSDDLTQAVKDSLESEGTYKLNGSKLVLTDEDGTKVFEGKFDVDEDTLKLKSGVTRSLISALLPLTFDKK